jgi:hypothetical protein
MAAGLGFKDFTTGEVLTAADVDGYLMQGVWVFASAAARDAAVTSPQEGNFAYLKDTNVTTYYTGSAWANLDTTGMTNPMTTTGDTIYSSSGSTPARLGIGTTGQVLTVAGGVPSWAAPAGGGKVLQVVSATTTTDTSITSTSLTDTSLTCSITPSSATSKVLVLVTQYIGYAIGTENNGAATIGVALLRGATNIYNPAGSDGVTDEVNVAVSGASMYRRYMFNVSYLDSPATTSATTYKTQARRGSGNSFTVRPQQGDFASTITLLEIGA